MLEDEYGGGAAVSSDDETKPCVELASWTKRPEVKFIFDCQEISRSGVARAR